MRRIGVLMNAVADDPEMQARITAFHEGLQEVGWVVGRNVRVDALEPRNLRKAAAELVAHGPDVMLAGAGPTTPALQQVSRTVPTVFAQAVDPVGNGFVASLARPGGNVTGFTQFEYSLSGKWLELLREVAPQVGRVGVIRDLVGGPVGIGQWAVIQAFASPLGIELSPIDIRVAGDAERLFSAFAREPNGGLIVSVGTPGTIHRELIIALAARHRLPAVYPYRYNVAAGGLVSYGPNLIEPYRRAAGYVDRILKGEKPADLPVQAPTKYDLTINLKTAKALGLEIPSTVLARADEVIE